MTILLKHFKLFPSMSPLFHPWYYLHLCQKQGVVTENHKQDTSATRHRPRQFFLSHTNCYLFFYFSTFSSTHLLSKIFLWKLSTNPLLHVSLSKLAEKKKKDLPELSSPPSFPLPSVGDGSLHCIHCSFPQFNMLHLHPYKNPLGI